jgi:hypothetical protein
MLSFFKLFSARQLTTDQILNRGLEIAMEFGKNWNQPIQNRLSKKFASLTHDKLDEYNQICRTAMTESHEFLWNTLDEV